MIKAAFFDLDGTFLDPNTHKVPKDNKKVIEELQAKGIQCFVASGRSFKNLASMEGVLDVKWDGYICNNGAMLYDRAGKAIKENFLSEVQIQQLLAKCEKDGITLMLRTPDYDISPLGVDQYMVEAHTFFAEPLARYVKSYEGEHVFMALIYAAMDYDFYSIDKEIEGLRALPNRSTYADVVLATTSKATGLADMGTYFGFTKDEIIAFGDELNDLDMLAYASTSVAMGNGNPKVKELATYTTANVDEQGIRKACIHFNLI